MKVRIEFEDGDKTSDYESVSFSSDAASDTTDSMLKFVKSLNRRNAEYIVAKLIDECLDVADVWMFLSPESKAEIIGEINDEAKDNLDDDSDEES